MQPCVMRPWRSTWVASTTTKAAPELASMPRCIMCQSVALPSSAEYWHMGAITIRLASSRPASLMGENKALMGVLTLRFWGALKKLQRCWMDFKYAMMAPTSSGSYENSGMSGWPETMPSASASSSDSTG